MTEMTDESMMLEYDLIEKEHEEALAAKNKLLDEKDAEIERLKQQIARLKT